jgi:hypothetical protein
MIISFVVLSTLAMVFLCWPNRANPKNKKYGAATFVSLNFDEGASC